MLTTPLERYYRHLLLVERLEQIQSELDLVAHDLSAYADASERTLLHLADSSVKHAMHLLREAQAAVRVRIAPELLEAQLEASIEYVNQSPERMRRQGER